MVRVLKIIVITIASILIGSMILGIVGIIGFGFYNFFKGLLSR